MRYMSVIPARTGPESLTVCCPGVVLCFCVAEMLVEHGPALPSAPRKDGNGRELCIVCTTRLSRVKGKRLSVGAAHVCQACINEIWPPHTSRAAAAAGSVVLHHPTVTPGELLESLAAVAAAIITTTTTTTAAATTLFSTATIDSHGWMLLPVGSRSLVVLQRGWSALLASGEIRS